MSVVASCCPLPAESRDAGFQRALDPEQLRELVQAHGATGAVVRDLQPDYVRWKEQDGSLVGFRARVSHDGHDHDTYLTVRTADSHRLADEASRLQHLADDVHAGLRAWILLPDEELLLLAFPFDRAMPDLRRVVRASKVRSLIVACCPAVIPTGLRISKSRSSYRIARYKPERRAVLCWTLVLVNEAGEPESERVVWLRCYAAPDARRNRVATTAAQAAGIRCPTALALPHNRLLLEAHVNGRTWTMGDAGPDAAAAATLARLHGASSLPELPRHGMLDELDQVLRTVDDLGRLRPDLGREAAIIADALAHTVSSPGAPVLSHGDFHPGQVLLAKHEAGLCDFDRACLAPAAYDLATLHAHCVDADPLHGAARSLAFQRHYGRFRALPPDSEIGWWTTCALLRASMSGFRALRPDWPVRASNLLAAAHENVRAARPAYIL